MIDDKVCEKLLLKSSLLIADSLLRVEILLLSLTRWTISWQKMVIRKTLVNPNQIRFDLIDNCSVYYIAVLIIAIVLRMEMRILAYLLLKLLPLLGTSPLQHQYRYIMIDWWWGWTDEWITFKISSYFITISYLEWTWQYIDVAYCLYGVQLTRGERIADI